MGAQHEARSEALLDAQSWMAKEIEETLSEDALAAAALADGTPAVVALDGERLCWLTLDGSREGEVRTHLGSLPLVGLSIAVDGVLKPRGAGIGKTRTWHLTSPSSSVSVTTESIRRGAFAVGAGLSPAEKIMQELARRCGQPIPLPAPPRSLAAQPTLVGRGVLQVRVEGDWRGEVGQATRRSVGRLTVPERQGMRRGAKSV